MVQIAHLKAQLQEKEEAFAKASKAASAANAEKREVQTLLLWLLGNNKL